MTDLCSSMLEDEPRERYTAAPPRSSVTAAVPTAMPTIAGVVRSEELGGGEGGGGGVVDHAFLDGDDRRDGGDGHAALDAGEEAGGLRAGRQLAVERSRRAVRRGGRGGDDLRGDDDGALRDGDDHIRGAHAGLRGKRRGHLRLLGGGEVLHVPAGDHSDVRGVDNAGDLPRHAGRASGRGGGRGAGARLLELALALEEQLAEVGAERDAEEARQSYGAPQHESEATRGGGSVKVG
eukprot:CAMPEP_0195568880 /NCGR_PEP_ID=MMETSP0814-20130614/2500_1 /TAXON_ID=97485 /ORGANISM="Prymnesium parvum, Strain Texoma1" /LENGTH=235 /DNA_ID=CAMNT_0040704221 /DNA_START=402 /DNA_END=1104 /DNA_ORIENTATION=+